MTLEDETGMINVVIWNGVGLRQRRALLCSKLLGVNGLIEREGEVTHVIAGRLIDLTGMLGELEVGSRDFR